MKNIINQYIADNPSWAEILTKINQILEQLPLEITFKWNAPVYVYKGKNVVGLAAFKNYCGLWFFQGALLNDAEKVLFNAQEGKTKAMMQWRFYALPEVDSDTIKNYVLEAIENVTLGKKIAKTTTQNTFTIPSELESEFVKNPNFKECFESFSLSCQKEYALYIAEAKKPETRIKRLQKCIEMILEKKELHSSYKKN